MTYSNHQFNGPTGVGATGPAGAIGATGPSPGTTGRSRLGPFVRTPWIRPARWFGYKWRRAEMDPINIGYHYQYWTDKQLAHRAFRLGAQYDEAHINEHYRE